MLIIGKRGSRNYLDLLFLKRRIEIKMILENLKKFLKEVFLEIL